MAAGWQLQPRLGLAEAKVEVILIVRNLLIQPRNINVHQDVVMAGMLGPLEDDGAKSTSHRSPYVSVRRGVTRQVSCANRPRL